MKTENQEEELGPIGIVFYQEYEGGYDFEYGRKSMQEMIDPYNLIEVTINPKVKNVDVLRELQNMIEVIREADQKKSKYCHCLRCL